MSGLEILGYAASVLVAASLTMRSVVRLRLLNLAGALLFTAYGLLLRAYPVAAVNGFIAVVNTVYLLKMRPGRRRELFELLEIPRSDNRYLRRFLAFHAEDIRRFFPGFRDLPATPLCVVFILRDMLPVGLVVCRARGEGELEVVLDYVIPAYRDLRCGRFFYTTRGPELARAGYRTFLARAETRVHARYLRRMGFRPVAAGEDGWYARPTAA